MDSEVRKQLATVTRFVAGALADSNVSVEATPHGWTVHVNGTLDGVQMSIVAHNDESLSVALGEVIQRLFDLGFIVLTDEALSPEEEAKLKREGRSFASERPRKPGFKRD